MKNKKRNTIITAVVIALIILCSATYLFLNYSPDEESLTILEKKWITDNANKIVDVNVYNDIPVYGYNGEGIIFDFLDYFTETNQIRFNKISYYTTSEMPNNSISFQVINHDALSKEQDIVLYQDHYVILSKESSDTISLDNTFTLGILENDKDIAKNYFNKSITIKEYENIDKLLNALDIEDEEEKIDYILLPNLSNMDDILKQELNIVYHLEDLKKDFILKATDETVYNTLSKSYNKYLNSKFQDDYIKNYLNIYYKSTSTSELEQTNYNAKTYKYGYTINMPYENYVNEQFVGTILNYLNSFDKSTGVDIETTPYQTIDELKSALVNGEIDFALGNFNYDNINMEHTLTSAITDLDYVVLSKNDYKINSLKGLKQEKVSVVASSLLHQELINSGVEAKTYANTDDLLRNIDDFSIVLMDKNTYTYYINNKLQDYNIILESSVKDGLRFILNKQNEPFNSIFKYFINSADYQTIKYNYNTNVTIDKDYTTLKILAFLVSLVTILIITIIIISKRTVTTTIINKDEKLKYIDPMTSLKNRTYLNKNIYKWDDNVIFPQSIITLDINSLREINDTYGREVGDEIINKVASILINNQLENTDIIRSGGDEFLIYLVGYEEKEVSTYARKLVTKMKDIPNSKGVEMGYSMIMDEVKTVDDAINEAITMMVKTKEKKKNKE